MSTPVRLVWCLFSGLLCGSLQAQEPPENGPRKVVAGWHALVGGTAVVRPGERVEDATIVVRDGKIASVQSGQPAPDGARVWDCAGLTVYAGFLEPHLAIDAPAPDPGTPGIHWNPSVLPQRGALDGPGITEEDRKALRKLGFGAAAVAPTGGIFKGSAAVVLLSDPARGELAPVVNDHVYQAMGFRGGSGGYPNSQMGAIAVMRQVLLDADWHERRQATHRADPDAHGPVPRSDALDALITQRRAPLLFDTSDELEILRAAKIAAEFEKPAMILGNGMEFRRLDAVAAAKLPILVPVHFPETPDVSTIAKAEAVTLHQLVSWEQAPTNLKRLLDKGVAVALTTTRLPKREEFWDGVRQAVACGVTADQALKLLTTAPAELLGVGGDLGTIAPGKLANLTLVDGDLFSDDEAVIRTVWVQGTPVPIDEPKKSDPEGEWMADVALGDGIQARVEIAEKELIVHFGDEEAKAKGVAVADGRVDFVLQHEALGQTGLFTFHAQLEGEQLFGTGVDPTGASFRWAAQRKTGEAVAAESAESEDTPETDAFEPPAITELPLPLGAYGLNETPAQVDLVLTGATLWTSGPRGIVTQGALWVQDGKIVFAGPVDDLPELPATATVVNLEGKHVTPGLIDCHSHTGISRGINESGQTVTSEVRIGDVVNPDDVGWYRELAGGVTAVNQLHGSSNPIGGQNSVVKLRWGAARPGDMALDGAPAGIKFALGENPRRANSSEPPTRYPGSRMGVEAIIRDRFVAARDYAREWQRYEALSPRERAAVMPPRRDLELEAIAEILAGERLIHCHSYRQDEIFMLCRLAQEFGFKVGTFQHVLEGYKVADAIKDAAIGASSFSDWWAYKLEVFDAVPDNGAIMHEVGVNVSFNSDSNELARRLNTEAGKAVKYGGVAPAEALKFVTLNPAIQLGIQDRVGSLERGKDADFAIWSNNPLSYAARCEATYVEGRPYFTLERDAKLRAEAKRERLRLLQKALAKGGGKPEDGDGKPATDAYWAAQDQSGSYTCCDIHGGQR